MRRNVVRRYDIAIKYFCAWAGDCTHGQFGVPGDAQLSDDIHIEWDLQFARNLITHGNSAARQGENDDIVPIFVVGEAARNKLTSLAAIVESLRVIHLSC